MKLNYKNTVIQQKRKICEKEQKIEGIENKNSKAVNLSPNISIISLNVKGLIP